MVVRCQSLFFDGSWGFLAFTAICIVCSKDGSGLRAAGAVHVLPKRADRSERTEGATGVPTDQKIRKKIDRQAKNVLDFA